MKSEIKPILLQYAEANVRMKECENSNNKLDKKEISMLQIQKTQIRMVLTQKCYNISLKELEALKIEDITPNAIITNDDYHHIRWRGKDFTLKPLQIRFLKAVMQIYKDTGSVIFDTHIIFTKINSQERKFSQVFRKVDGSNELFTFIGICLEYTCK